MTVTYAIDSIELGDRSRGGLSTSTTAWQEYGFDLDSKRTDNRSTDVCARAAGAPSSVQQDGAKCGLEGIDNSFGANVLPILQSAFSLANPSEAMTDAIRGGAFTLQFEVFGLDPTKPSDSAGLTIRPFTSSFFDLNGAKPMFAPTEDWPVRSDRVDANDAGVVSKESLEAWIASGTLVGKGRRLTVDLFFPPSQALPPVTLTLPIQNAVVSMDVQGNSITGGRIGGVIPTTELIDLLQRLSGSISPSLCGSAFDGIAQQIRQTADMPSNAVNARGVPCDAVSVGLGFTAKRIANPTRTSGPPQVLDPCATDAGKD